MDTESGSTPNQGMFVVTDEMADAGYEVANTIGPEGVLCQRDWLEQAYLAMRALEPLRHYLDGPSIDKMVVMSTQTSSERDLRLGSRVYDH